MQPYRPRIRTNRLLIQRIKDELLIYDVERNEAHCLNGIAAVVWAFCDGQRTVSEIAQQLGPDLPANAAETLVWSALDQFAERHLLEEAETDNSAAQYIPENDAAADGGSARSDGRTGPPDRGLDRIASGRAGDSGQPAAPE